MTAAPDIVDSRDFGTEGAATAPGTRADLASRYDYQRRFVRDREAFLAAVRTRTIVPHQVEVQPGRMRGKALCWMACPYCYGGSAENTGERLPVERLREIVRETADGPHGGVGKLVFAGYATDPLNYEDIDALIDQARRSAQVIGVHTKALRVSERLVETLAARDIAAKSYFSVSLDAGDATTYNEVHGLRSRKDVYSIVLANLRRLARARDTSGASLDLSATYLITRANRDAAQIRQAIADVRGTGIDLLRFSLPQVPRGHEDEEGTIIPTRSEITALLEELTPIIEAENGKGLRVLIADYDTEFGIESRRSLPCVARFVFPSIGFDGYLAHCSESAAPHFRDMQLGDLRERGFWDLYYDYDAEDLWRGLSGDWRRMGANDCRCDRKEHAVNAIFRDLPEVHGIVNESAAK